MYKIFWINRQFSILLCDYKTSWIIRLTSFLDHPFWIKFSSKKHQLHIRFSLFINQQKILILSQKSKKEEIFTFESNEEIITRTFLLNLISSWKCLFSNKQFHFIFVVFSTKGWKENNQQQQQQQQQQQNAIC